MGRSNMTGPLKNVRHERYVQALFEGKPASTAYEEAGYRFNEGNAIRLKGNEKVQARPRELQETVAEANEVTVSSLLGELEQARAKASSLDQLSAAVRAIEAKAKVSGIMIQRVEVGSPGDFSNCRTLAETVDRLIEIEAPGVNFSAEDKAKMHDLLVAMSEPFNSRKAEPVTARYPSQRQIELSRGDGYKRVGHR
jgi:hypothetical protein